ncbi:glycosyltransferase family 2 protein [Candidatus Saccharibacteria bacterium]|nr:glycosyltransferase family 2 protein [Candidatus Saccharibacteria bacterium]
MTKKPSIDLEIPLGKRTPMYRLFEMVPAVITYGAFILLIILSFVSPLWAAIYLLIILTSVLVRAVRVAFHTILGHRRLMLAQKVDWAARLADLDTPEEAYNRHYSTAGKQFGMRTHLENLRLVQADSASFPKPSELYNMVIVAAYNEGYDVLQPTLRTLTKVTYDAQRMIVALAYEERGGEEMEATARRLEKEFKGKFKEFMIIKHPRDLPDEVVGKGPNISYAGERLKEWCDKEKLAYKNVIITTLDADNRPHAAYFDYVTYEYIINIDRKHLAYQPIALFLNNIWDVPAPMRVVATGNTFWNIISSMRPYAMRNFASHSQSMDALVEMNFWSRRSIVEDGHHFWRSYFYFNGNYSVHPVYIPVYQDAVLDNTYAKTFKAQFIQLRRWMYGVSDIAFIAVRIFTRKRTVPFWPAFVWFIRALDGYVTAGCMAIIVAVGGWVPLLVNPDAYNDMVAHQLPDVVSMFQRVALLGLIIIVFLSMRMLPPRPARYKRTKTVWMVLQWVLMPLTAIGYLSFAALNSQARLFFGRYLVKFDVTTKATLESRELARMEKLKTHPSQLKPRFGRRRK